jgi:hypothetical protein
MAVAMAICVVPAMGQRTWTYEGSSSLTVANPPADLDDDQRLYLYDMVIDDAGNVFFSAGQNGFFNVADDPMPDHGVSVLPAGGGPIQNVNLDDEAGISIPGGITDMILGPDGKVYALQNYNQIAWDDDTGASARLLKIELVAGTLTVSVAHDFGTSGFGNNPITYPQGIAAAADGNIYITRHHSTQGLNNKFNWVDRFDTATQTFIDASPTDGINMGREENHRMDSDIFYIGQNGDDEPEFVIMHVSDNSSSELRVDQMIFASSGDGGGRFLVSGGSTGNLFEGARNMTATAYDPIRQVAWIGPRGRITGWPDPCTSTCIMARFRGATETQSSLFPLRPNIPGTEPFAWHANGNDPCFNSNPANGPADGSPLIQYWVSEITVDPGSGDAWIAIGAGPEYDYVPTSGHIGELGYIYNHPHDGYSYTGDEGRPHDSHPTDSTNRNHVVSIAFGPDKVYAVTADLVTGEFSLYSSDLPVEACCLPSDADTQTEASCDVINPGVCELQGGVPQGPATTCGAIDCSFQTCNTPFADADGDFDVDSDDYGIFQACISTGTPADDAAGYPPVECTCFDTDDSGEVDLTTDLPAFINCAGGPNAPIPGTCNP